MAHLTTDVLIVGSGPTGAAFSRILKDAAPDLDIVIAEAGPALAQPLGRHFRTFDPEEVERVLATTGTRPATGEPSAFVYNRPGTELIEPEGDMPAAASVTSVGGMGSFWTGACPSPGDGERIDFIPRQQWDAALARARDLLRVVDDAFPGSALSERVRAVLGGLYDEGRPPERRVQAMPLAVELTDGGAYWTGTDVVFGDVLERRGVRLLDEHVVRELVAEEGRMTGALLHDVRGARDVRVTARAVVVAADSIRTPQLLWASGIRPRALGHYLNDHIQMLGRALLDTAATDGAQVDVTGGELEHGSGVNWVPYDEPRFPLHGQIMQMDASPVEIAELDLASPVPGSVVGIGIFAPKTIRFEDHVSFDEDRTDAHGLPAPSIRYSYTEEDHETIARAAAEIRRMVGALGAYPGRTEPILLPPGSSLHYQGTVRMGAEDDGTSVCDSFSRVWGTEGLVVAGNGVIPTSTACNPTLTSVALAVRAAEQLARELTLES